MRKPKGMAKTGKNFLMSIPKMGHTLAKGGTNQKPMAKSKLKPRGMPKR